MRKTFTKKDLHTGDIIETRSGERGVVILELDCILYQAGGLDILDEVFTDDLFIDGPQREGDIFKVYHDPDGPLGFNKLFGLEPVFRRKNNKRTKERAAELNDKYDEKKGKVKAIIFDSYFRRCEERYINPSLENSTIDFAISEAPSMTANGQIRIDRTFIPVPDTENLYIFFNAYQEEWHREMDKERRISRDTESKEPIVIIPEKEISIYSRCMLVRKESADRFENLKEKDFEIAKKYLNSMQLL